MEPDSSSLIPNSMKNLNRLEKLALKITQWVGTPASIIIHTIIFSFIFALPFFGVGLNTMLLVLTTALSVEAIYLAIFIQLTVNHSARSLAEVEQDIDEIEKDIDEIQEDVEEIQEEHEEDDEQEAKTEEALEKIQGSLQKLSSYVESLRNQK